MGGGKHWNLENFIQKCKQIHGNKYSYEYIKNLHWRIKIPIYCNNCKEIFYQDMHSHLSGSGCRKCSLERAHAAVKSYKNFIIRKENFIINAIKVHGSSYNYDAVEYVNSSTKVKIYCNSCNEYFTQTPTDHLSGCGCSICRITRYSNTRITKSAKIFFTNAPIIHNNKYDYSKVIYKGTHKKVTIFCKRCNKYFSQTPSSHLKGKGCVTCGNSLSQEEFLTKAKNIHGNNYNYSEVHYITGKTPVKIKCNYCGDFFMQKPSHHLNGYGCKCNKGGYSKSSFRKVCERNSRSDPKVYVIKCYNENEEFIKIGMTSKSVYSRFRRRSDIPYSYQILKEIKGSPDFVWNKERELHILCKSFKYTPQLSFFGMRECFTLECLNLLNI